MKSLVFFPTILLMAVACSVDNPVVADLSQLGAIEGRVVDSLGQGCARLYVSIDTLGIAAITDTAGIFTFRNLPSGSYRLTIGDTSADVTVENGKTLLVADLIYNRVFTRPTTGVLRLEIHYFHQSEELVWVGGGSDLGMSQPIRLNADSIYMRCVIGEIAIGENAEIRYLPSERRTAFFQNSKQVQDTMPFKGRFSTPVLQTTGADTFTITVDNVISASFIVIDSIHIKDFLRNQVTITTERIVLHPRYNDDVWGAYSSSKWMVVGQDTFRVSYDNLSVVDWDLYLVDESTRDTCFWRNREPDWGVAGNELDDPAFSGDAWGVSWGSEVSGHYYSSDRIRIEDPAPGIYSIYIAYVDGPHDTLTATPRLGIEVGISPQTSQIQKFFQNSPQRALRENEIWYAGRITFPGGTYDPREQKILSGPVLQKERIR